jgi:hypothetical protein
MFMKLELKKIKVNLAFSEETTQFMADIFFNGKKIGYAKNDGQGGCTDYHPYEGQREAMREAEEYAKTLPSLFYEFGGEKREIKMSLENWIDKQIEDYLLAKEQAKLEKKMDTQILIKCANGTHRVMGFKGNKMKLKDMPNDMLMRLVSAAKASLQDGDVILNKNI